MYILFPSIAIALITGIFSYVGLFKHIIQKHMNKFNDYFTSQKKIFEEKLLPQKKILQKKFKDSNSGEIKDSYLVFGQLYQAVDDRKQLYGINKNEDEIYIYNTYKKNIDDDKRENERKKTLENKLFEYNNKYDLPINEIIKDINTYFEENNEIEKKQIENQIKNKIFKNNPRNLFHHKPYFQKYSGLSIFTIEIDDGSKEIDKNEIDKNELEKKFNKMCNERNSGLIFKNEIDKNE